MQQQENGLINQYIYYNEIAALNFFQLKDRMNDTHLLNTHTGVPPTFYKTQKCFSEK